MQSTRSPDPIPRLSEHAVRAALVRSPAVALLGPRQVGKTTLARRIAADFAGAIYLDLETSRDRARLGEPRAFFERHRGELLVLDEIQNLPGIFAELRGEIDADRRPGRFLILGSASTRLLKQSSESLAGRLELVDMAPLLVAEACAKFEDVEALWLRGGFPRAYLAASDDEAWQWRDSFLRNLLMRDLPALGINVAPETMRRFWRMLSHVHGQLFNASAIGASLGVTAPTVSRYLDALTSALMLRRLEPFYANLGKRLVKSPKIYVRDSGLLHHLLGIATVDDLASHPAAGASWEGFIVEQICNRLPRGGSASFYRTAAGAELDLVVETGRTKIGYEVKFSTAPQVTKGFWLACEDVGVDRAYVVAPVRDGWPMAANVEVISPLALPG
jgi:predicted AAA+ superfamily ATPase